jgi:hypothetical protein
MVPVRLSCQLVSGTGEQVCPARQHHILAVGRPHLISSVNSSKSRAAVPGLRGAPLVLAALTSSAAARACTERACTMAMECFPSTLGLPEGSAQGQCPQPRTLGHVDAEGSGRGCTAARPAGLTANARSVMAACMSTVRCVSRPQNCRREGCKPP